MMKLHRLTPYEITVVKESPTPTLTFTTTATGHVYVYGYDYLTTAGDELECSALD